MKPTAILEYDEATRTWQIAGKQTFFAPHQVEAPMGVALPVPTYHEGQEVTFHSRWPYPKKLERGRICRITFEPTAEAYNACLYNAHGETRQDRLSLAERWQHEAPPAQWRLRYVIELTGAGPRGHKRWCYEEDVIG